ncbi:hypothetical protein MTR67_018097 [Solanum verrucosum]|uniref:Uncharacterized protein n=1 Tax=Solanum verrucosum TaxID=315347 RepID=A0AAF0TLA7_SOLVR|nr:hypothetical protein MTR67_018097 [Solanum verrucosum]
MDRRLIDEPSVRRIRTLKGEKKSRTLIQERSEVSSVPAPKSKDFSVEFVTRYVGFHWFRFSVSRSRLDRFSIFSSVASVVSPHSSRTSDMFTFIAFSL